MDKRRIEVRGLNGAFYEVSLPIKKHYPSVGACALEGRSVRPGAVSVSISFCLLLGPHQVHFWKHAGSCLRKQVSLILFINSSSFIIFILFKLLS